MRLEKFLDPNNLRSDLLDQFRKSRPATGSEPPKIEAPYAFDDQTLFASHRAPLRLMRKLLMPLLKLFFNPNVLNQILHTQAQFNVDLLKREARRQHRVRPFARRVEFAVLRGPAQPGARNHAHGHRGPEPAHENRVAFEPAGFQRTARPSARRRRPVPVRKPCARPTAKTMTIRPRRSWRAADRSRDSSRPAASRTRLRARVRVRVTAVVVGVGDATPRASRVKSGCRRCRGCLRCSGCAKCAGCRAAGR